MSQLLTRSVFFVTAGLFTCRKAHAYLDPSTITAASQLFAALCTWAVLGLFFFKNQFVKVVSKVRYFIKLQSAGTKNQRSNGQKESSSDITGI